MALLERLINVKFELGTGSFGTSGSDTVNLSGHRVSAKITKAGGHAMSELDMTIYGMTLSLMNQLATLGLVINLVRRNTITVTAGDAVTGLSTVFTGTITNGWFDGDAAPEVAFHVAASSGLFEAVAPLAPSSFPGATSIVTILQGLATQAGLAFNNNGVTGTLAHPYYWGSARNQIALCAEEAGINWIIDNQALTIWPKGQFVQGSVPLISKDTGMVGYPAYTSKGIRVRTLFNPNIGYGSRIEVQSSFDQANGPWIVYLLDYDLEANTPNGQWFSTIEAARPGLAPIR